MTLPDCNNFVLFSLFSYIQNGVHYLYIFSSLILIKIRKNIEYFHNMVLEPILARLLGLLGRYQTTLTYKFHARAR